MHRVAELAFQGEPFLFQGDLLAETPNTLNIQEC